MNDETKKIVTRASLMANALLLVLFFIYSGIVEREHANRIYSLSKKILLQEMAGDSLLKEVTEKGEKIYEFENLAISKDAAIEDLKRRLKEQAREYKEVSNSLTISMSAKSDTVKVFLEPEAQPQDSMTISLPRSFTHQEPWLTMSGIVKKDGNDLAMVIPSISMPSGKIHIDNLTPKRKLFQLKKPEEVIRIQVESPYYSMLSARQFSVPKNEEKSVGRKLFLPVLFFTLGGLTFMAIGK